MMVLARIATAFAIATFLVGGVVIAHAAKWGTGHGRSAAEVQYTQKKKCNAGRGNGSEGCDPGNSSTSPNGSTGQNQGGDEGGPIRGGTGAP